MSQPAFTDQQISMILWASTSIDEAYHCYGVKSGAIYHISSHHSLTTIREIADQHPRPWVIVRNGAIVHLAGQPPFVETAV